MMDLRPVDLATLQAGPKTDALVAEWMGWERNGNWWCKDGLRLYEARPNYAGYWSPSTNHAHAGEARRKATVWTLDITIGPDGPIGIECHLGLFEGRGTGRCQWGETNGDEGQAEALATCRAIVAAMKATEGEQSEGCPNCGKISQSVRERRCSSCVATGH